MLRSEMTRTGKASLSSVPHICTLQDGRRRSVSGVNHSLTALLHVPSARWAPNRSGSVKDGEAAHSRSITLPRGTSKTLVCC